VIYCLKTLKLNNMYSLKSNYYKREFDTIEELIQDVVVSGMDPNIEITEDGKGIQEYPIDYLDE